MIEFKDKRVVKFHHFQKRNENHGEDLVPAIDIGITLKGAIEELKMIHKDLPASLMRAGERPEGAKGLDLPIDDLSHVRVPSMLMPVKFEHEQTGMLLHVEYGIGGAGSDIVLSLVKLSKVRVTEIHEGGFCVWQFVLSCSNEIDQTVIGKVAMMDGYDVTLTLTAPEIEQKEPQLSVADVFGDQGDKPPKLTVEDVFVNQSKPAPTKPAAKVAKKKPAAKTARKKG